MEKQVSVCMPIEVIEAIKKIANRKMISKSALIRMVLSSDEEFKAELNAK